MSERLPESVVEEIAASFVLAEPSNPQSLEGLITLLQELAQLPCVVETPVQQHALDCLAIVARLLKRPTDVNEMLSSLDTKIHLLQEAVCALGQTIDTSNQVDSQIKWDEESLEVLGEFLEESQDGLNIVDHILMNAEFDEMTTERVNDLFRVFHSIKGTAGFLELSDIVSLGHTTETLLNCVREGEVELVGEVLDVVFDATALMRRLLENLKEAADRGESVEPAPSLPALLTKLKRIIDGEELSESDPIELQPVVQLGQILVQSGDIQPEQLDQALMAQAESGRRLGEELVAQAAAEPKRVAQALRCQSARANVKLKESIKVDVRRVDQLVETIGELVIAETMVVNLAEVAAIQSHHVRNHLGHLTKITRDLQDVGMLMRMVPLRGVFSKMARMVRDLSRKSGKQVRLVQEGEWTEVDRSMVEQIADPLVHMIRNAVDHGIESAEEREKRGKQPCGLIRLSAYQQGSNIVIEIRDDGRGLDRNAIVTKARSQGLVSDSENLSDAEVYELIFAPGFSTAKQITEISGRGVGMDVVKRNIEAMHGTVAISATPGHGTIFKITFPLTLAIIDGMLVSCGEERYIIPALSIVESFLPTEEMMMSFAERGELVIVRNRVLPLFRLDRLLGIDGAKKDPTESLIVVLESMGRKLALQVDEVITLQQVVIKKLDRELSQSKFVAGAAILSDGLVGLILNVEELGSLCQDEHPTTPRAQPGIAAETPAMTSGSRG